MSGMSINTNMSALRAQRHITQSANQLQEKFERLSSGLRINSASDDASGLAISQKMTGQIRGQSQAIQNLQDGLSLLQTAEGGTGVIEGNLQRIRELSVQASNATLTDQDRQAIQDEVSQLKEEINRVSDDTEFNKKKLLNGDIDSSNGGVDLQAGANENQTINVSVGDLSTSSLGVDSVDVSTQSGAQDAIPSVDDALGDVSSVQTEIGAASNRIEQSIDANAISRENLSAGRSRIRDANIATEAAGRAQASILTQAGTLMLAQANQLQGSNALSLLG